MSVDGNQKFFIFLFLVECIWAKSGEVCFPFGSTEPNVNPPQTAVGRPGKTGPRGPPGIGERGPPGACACNPNEIEQLREEIQLQEVEFCAVGLKDGGVKDQDITASSVHGTAYEARFARLDRIGTRIHYGGWLSYARAVGEWIQVDLKTPTPVVAVVTQGLNYPGSAQYWLTTYKISYGNSTSSLQLIQNRNGGEMIFNGNTDRNTHVINEFPSPVTARYYRLIVQSWHNWGVVRLEYLTC